MINLFKTVKMAPYSNRVPPVSRTIMAFVEMDNAEQPSVELSSDEDVEELASVSPPPPNVLPESLPLENSLPQLLMSQSGVTEEYELADQTSIRLRIISKEMSLQRLSIYMPSLIELDLSGSWLLSLRDLGCGLRIKILKVARCGLDCLDGLLGLTTLKELHAESNCIKDIGSCAVLPRLQLLDLTRNRVDELGIISFLSICTQLRDLNLSENPVSIYPEFREVVLDVLPGLSRLNGEPLAVDEMNNLNDKDVVEDEGFDKESHEIPSEENRKPDEESEQSKDLPRNPSDQLSMTPLTVPPIEKSSIKKHERPSTSIGMRLPTVSSERSPQRPHTAGSKKKITSIGDNLDLDTIDEIQENSASRLTSGRIVCGNLTAALRRRPRQIRKDIEESWCHQPIKNCNSTCNNTNIDKNKSSEANTTSIENFDSVIS